MNMFTPLSLMACAFALVGGAANTFADGLDDGDFSKGKGKWLGEGQIVYLNADGTISPTDESKSTDPLGTSQKPKPTQIIELKLHTGQFTNLSQRFRTEKGSAAMNVEVVYKGSSDFKLNDKATTFTKGNTWQAGTTWYWTSVAFPKTDLCLRLDRYDGHSYKLESVKPGAEWQTAKFRWESVKENQDVTLLILAAPGHGSLWVKSVAVSG
jgi:hypothetical protein